MPFETHLAIRYRRFAISVDHRRHAGPALECAAEARDFDQTLADPVKAEMCAFWRAHMAALPNTIGEAAHAVVERRGVIDEIRRAQRPILAIAGGEDHAEDVSPLVVWPRLGC
jgi:pimeloyl-ACP methyl ester carboxylesterase